MDVRVRTRLVLASGLLILAGAGLASARPRVGYANLAVDGDHGAKTIAGLREAVRAEGRFEDVAEGPARFALEDAIDPADTPEADALRRASGQVAKARASYAAFAYDDALDLLRQAETALRSVAPSATVVAALADLHLLAGQAHLGGKDEGKALAAFALVRRLDPARTSLDEALYRPQVVQLYAQAGASAGSATVNVSSEPPDAKVLVDGRAVGATPVAQVLDAGDHYVAVVLDGHMPRVEKVRVEDGKLVELSLLLSRQPPEDHARAVRGGLLRENVTAEDWRRGAAALAESASVDFLVIVRDAGAGGLEAGVYDAKALSFSGWVGATDGKAVVAALPAAAAPIKIAVPDPRGSKLPGGGAFDPPRPPPPPVPWYRTGWGTAALIGSAVAITATVLIVASPSPDTMITNHVEFGWGE